MKKIRNLVIGGIETKIFNLILLTIVIVSAVFLAVGLYHNRMLKELSGETGMKQAEAGAEITGELMDQVITRSMDRTAAMEAEIADDFFGALRSRVILLGDYAAKLFADPDAAGRAPYAAPDAQRDGEVTAQMILAEGVHEEEISSLLGLAANMSDMLTSLFGASEETNSCFIALPEGAFLVADNRSGSKFDGDGIPVPYDPRTRPWYHLAVEQESLIFTDVETDAFTGDIGIVCAMPVYTDGKLSCVVGSDLFLTSMRDSIEASEADGGFHMVINGNGHVVFSPKEEGIFRVVKGDEAPDLRASENEALARLAADALKEKTDVRMVSIEDADYYMMGTPVSTLGWAMISAFSAEAAGAPVRTLEESLTKLQKEAEEVYLQKSRMSNRTMIVLLVAAIVLLFAVTTVLGKRIVRPLNSITRKISELREGNLEFRMEDTYRTGDEIEVLAESFASISHKTLEYLENVKTVTAEKERISTELHMANRIQESVLPSIFPPFPDRPEFDIYATMHPAKEVGGDFYDFFLIDDDHLCMVIADVSGKGVPAALFMMISKVIVQSCAMLGKSAEEILQKTNEALCSNNQVDMFVTIWLGILEISTGKLTAANAGHEYPAVLGDNGRFELLKDNHGFVIGVIKNSRYREYELMLKPGNKLFVYTDGVPESVDAEEHMYGTDRMVEALNQDPGATPRQLLMNVDDSVRLYAGEARQFDDITMLALEYRGKN